MLIAVLIIVWLIAVVVAAIYYAKYVKAKQEVIAIKLAVEQYIQDKTVEIRAGAIKRSTAVVKGKVAEQLVPFREDFRYNPRDIRFLGSPIDLIVFDGLTEGAVKQIVLIEIKTGRSALSRRERQVAKAVEVGSVVFQTFRAKPLEVSDGV